MEKIIDKINSPKDLKPLKPEEKIQLSKEIREMIINTVSKNGGHLASNLGVVELTIALHSVFNTPTDKIVWDVGHQTYTHKILTGRKDQFPTIRQFQGISGFPKAKESEYDVFDTGHSSSSISIADGLAKARDLHGNDEYVIAVIGDGALTGGMAYEALNDVGSTVKKNFIVILNDNEMSISKNVGGLSKCLSKIRTQRFYRESNDSVRKICEHIPILGKLIIKAVSSIKYGIIKASIPNMLFEDLGFRYFGPIDGNKIDEVEKVLNLAKKEKERPAFIHIITKKGKGYKIAEENPDKYHSTAPFDVETGKPKNQKKAKDYSAVFGDCLVKLAEKDQNVVAVTAAMTDGTGLKKFKTQFPNRLFDVGIAEQNAITMSAGMAKSGIKPFVPIYGSFYQRCYDQVIDDICLQNLPVVMCIDRAGAVGQDGETHHGILDLAFFNAVPNLTVIAPKDFEELEQMMSFAYDFDRPIAIRYPRGGENGNVKFEKHSKITIGKTEILKSCPDAEITIIAIGKMVARAVEVADKLKEKNIECNIVNARFLNFNKDEQLAQVLKQTRTIVTIEDGIVVGGLSSSVQNFVIENGLKEVQIKSFGYPKTFIEHGTVEELEKKFGLDPDSIIEHIL